MHKFYKDITGQKFGRLTVLRREGRYRNNACWVCICECGAETKPIPSNNLRSGNTTSCGCNKARVRHGHYKTATYNSWASMIQRVTNPNHDYFHRYGGRGISICEDWKSFELFFRDMGERPEDKTLDRVDPDGNYEPGNCRWASPWEQTHNRSTR